MSFDLTHEAATQAWDDLAERLDRFIATWEAGREPALADYLPPEPPSHRRMVLVELIKVDMEMRITRHCEQSLERYAADHAELLDDGEPPCDLIYEEFHLRRTAGQAVSPRDYYLRYPRSAQSLGRLMASDDLSATTRVFAARRIEGLTAGQRIDDFDLLIELGKGAFGSVFLARQASMQRLVALKVSADKGNEPQALAALDHPNIIRVFDQRRLPDHRVRLLYMQFAPGGTLAEVIKLVHQTPPAARTGALLTMAVKQAVEKTGGLGGGESSWMRRLAAASWTETVCHLGVQLALALDHAHRQGVLHRDVKPANVLLAADCSPKLADFNISFCSQLDGASPAAYLGGSLAYMSPEQLEACNPAHERKPEQLDGRSDLYSLVFLLWELLHGERPFMAEDLPSGWSAMLAEMARRRRSVEPFAEQRSRDPLTARLERVLGKSLSADPVDRHPDGAALARELLLCLNARAWDLVHDLQSGWRNWARRWPLLALFPINLPPFALASLYNLIYNWKSFIVGSKNAEVVKAFWTMCGPLNTVLFSIGIFLVLYYAWPIATALRCLDERADCEPQQLREARRRSMRLGHWVAAVGLSLWLVAGISFPIGMHLLAGEFPVRGYIHFPLSMLMCGLISFCFPFLATAWLSVRVFLPALLASSALEAGEQKQLLALGRQAGYYVIVAAVVPMLALLLLVLSGSEVRGFTIVLILAGIAGFIAAYITYQRIRDDLAALSVVTRPPEMIGTTTDSVTNF